MFIRPFLFLLFAMSVLPLSGETRPVPADPDSRYIEIVERAFLSYTEDEVRAYFGRVRETGVTEHGFPRLTANLAVLVAHGRQTSLKPLMTEMMGFCCAEMARHNRSANDFSVRELVSALLALEESGAVPPETSRGWRADLAKIDPARCYDVVAPGSAIPVNNWAAFNAASEGARVAAGIASWDAVGPFIEKEAASQLLSFESSGMYRDPHNPMLYDVVARVQLATLRHFGLPAGDLGDRIDELLLRAVPLMLRMQSPSGELPFGGRSQQFLHNEAWTAALFEFYAARLKDRDPELAGQCRDAARLAADSIFRWLDAVPGSHVKNRWPRESMYGCEKYAYFDKYMITLGSIAYLADVFADPSVEPRPAPARTGGYVARTSDAFHKIFANAHGYFLEFDTAADFHYDGSGLGRVHRAGAPEALCLSVPFPGPDASSRLPEPNRRPMALCGASGWGDRWFCGSEDRYSVDEAAMAGDDAVVRLVSGHGFSESYRVAEDGVHVTVRSGNNAAYMIPVFATDGAASSEIASDGKSVSSTFAGWTCRYETDGELVDTGETVSNRTGTYRLFRASAPAEVSVVLRISR